MTKQTTEALIAESREVARQYDPAFRFVLTRVIDRLEAVAKDSSTGQQMHAYWQQRAEEAEQKRDGLAVRNTYREAERSSLSAAWEQVDPGPSDAEVQAAAEALAEWDGADWHRPDPEFEAYWSIPKSAYRRGARLALLAAQEVRRATTDL